MHFLWYWYNKYEKHHVTFKKAFLRCMLPQTYQNSAYSSYIFQFKKVMCFSKVKLLSIFTPRSSSRYLRYIVMFLIDKIGWLFRKFLFVITIVCHVLGITPMSFDNKKSIALLDVWLRSFISHPKFVEDAENVLYLHRNARKLL